MIKKIIALISAAIIVLNAFVLGAFKIEAAFTPAAVSDDGSDEGNEHGGTGGSFADVSTSDKYFDAVWGEIYSYANGNMSFDEFNKRVDSLTENYRNSNTIDGVLGYGVDNFATKVTALTAKVGSLAAQFGEGCLDIIKDYFENSFKDYEVLRDESTIDLKGHGALLVKDYYDSLTYIYCDYIVISPDTGYATLHQESSIYYYTESYDSSTGALADTNYTNWGTIYSYIALYGDVRYKNGEKAPTDDEYIQVFDGYDFGDLKYNELNDILDKMLEALNRQQPDLSSIEGILQALYYQCTGINDKMITYGQCNSLIMSLMSSGNKNTEQIVNALYELRDSLKNDTSDNGGGEDTGGEDPDKKEIAGTLYNVKPLDKNFLQNLVTDKQNLRVEYEGKIYYLEDDGTLLLNGKYYYVDMNYEGIYDVDIDLKNENIFANFDFDSLTTSQKNKLNNIVDLIFKFTSQIVPYTSIVSVLPMVQSIVFNTSTPQDIILKFDGTEYIPPFEATIFSVSFLHNYYVQKAIIIVKPFLTIVIGYSWLLIMRKKAVSMIGG